MSERMEVEVCCDNWEPDDFGWAWCGGCESDGPHHKALRKFVAPGTRTEALLRLAEAVLVERHAYDARMKRVTSGVDCSVDRLYFELVAAEEAAEEAAELALDCVRAFDQGEGKDA